MFGDFPTLADPRHADAYSPLWDAQLGLLDPQQAEAGLNTRQIDEHQVFNLTATRPDLLTGINPGQPGCLRPQLSVPAAIGTASTTRDPRILTPDLRSAGPCWPRGKNAAAW